MQAGFTFDANKCVGCQACQIACSIENQLDPGLSWRAVDTFNAENIDQIPHFHLSIACNHCQDAVCVQQCPALAISKNETNGVVIIDEKKCIGCKFCSWVCPYDAPKFDNTAAVMTKCTLCSHRLEEERNPACVSICPTEALGFEYFESTPEYKEVPGLPSSSMRPAIKITAFDPERYLPQSYEQPFSGEMVEQYAERKKMPKSKILLSSEWTLLIFSLGISILGALFYADVFGFININPIMFTLSGLFILALSTVHLGQKKRAYRAVFNWRKSWLSREIIFVNLFILCAALYLFLRPDIFYALPGLITVLVAAQSVDMVYKVTAQNPKIKNHSAHVFLTFLFLTSILTNFTSAAILTGLIKAVLYLKRKFSGDGWRYKSLAILRVLPIIILIPFSHLIESPLFLAFLFLAELIDRLEFYLELKIVTPATHMKNAFNNQLKKL